MLAEEAVLSYYNKPLVLAGNVNIVPFLSHGERRYHLCQPAPVGASRGGWQYHSVPVWYVRVDNKYSLGYQKHVPETRGQNGFDHLATEGGEWEGVFVEPEPGYHEYLGVQFSIPQML